MGSLKLRSVGRPCAKLRRNFLLASLIVLWRFTVSAPVRTLSLSFSLTAPAVSDEPDFENESQADVRTELSPSHPAGRGRPYLLLDDM